MTRVFVGAHFDDVVGSCGGMMSYLSSEGKQVKAVTVFGAHYQPPLSPFAETLHHLWGVEQGDDAVQKRKDENSRALQDLGVEEINLNYPEALYRKRHDQHLYGEEDSIFRAIACEDHALPGAIVRDILPMIDEETVCYFPYGIGHQVDHVLLKACGGLLEESGVPVWYYTDLSYEGSVDHQRYVTHVMPFDQGHFSAKLRSFMNYTSQIPMLFGDIEGVKAYFTRVNYSEGMFYETYYCKR